MNATSSALPIPVSRLAPTPSGYLHKGNVFNFIYTWLLVRSRKGILHLRIDDLDKPRVRPEYTQHIFDTLDWLDLTYDQGPKNAQELEEIYSQKHRMAAYEQARLELEQLSETYYCQCSRKEVIGQPDPCKTLNLPYQLNETALKVDTSQSTWISLPGSLSGDPNVVIPDFVIWRKDGMPAYQLASVVDDDRMGINLIVRGQDLWPSSIGQYYLAQLLDFKAFQKAWFIHHPLVKDLSGNKLSKSTKAAPLKSQFSTKKQVFRAVGDWLNLGENHESLDTLLNAFASRESSSR